MRLILFDMLLNPSFKMTRSFANIARTTDSAQVYIREILYTGKELNSFGIGSVCEKWFLILNELKTRWMLIFFTKLFAKVSKFIFDMAWKVANIW